MTGSNAAAFGDLWAEKSAAGGSYCRDGPVRGITKTLMKYGIFAMARRLLRIAPTSVRVAGRGISWSSAMIPLLGAASSAIDALAALTSSKPSPGANRNAENLFAFSGDASAPAGSAPGSGSGGGSQISPQTMSALLAAQSQSGTTASLPMSRSDALKDLFAQIDGDGDGKITKSEFESALGAGGTNIAEADDVFGKLDKDGDGSVSLEEMSSALKGGKGHHHGHHHMTSEADDGTQSDPLLQALQGATSTSSTNSDGSVTTSLTYADGSKVTMTSAASAGASGTAVSSYNFIEQLIQRQSSLISAQASSSLSVSV
jgi:Ca2+-binding EF-hand superfamily protein